MFKFNYKETAGIGENKIKKYSVKLAEYTAHLQSVVIKKDYQDLECSIQLSSDREIREQVKELAKKINPQKLKYVVVIGIGGSNLGTMAIYEALLNKTSVKMLFLDTVSSLKMNQVVEKLKNVKAEEFAIVAISKSGTTTETIANLEMLYQRLGENFEKLNERTIFITGENSKLWQTAEEKGIYKIAIPKMVGGRYSVFSAVGLLPLYLAGIDIDELHNGAQQAISDCVTENNSTNYSMISAITTFVHGKKDINIHNTFLFNPELESCGKWYRQLMGESIGKLQNLKGKDVRTGITPIVSIGSTDLHSMAQLYFGGPKDKFTNIVFAKTNENNKIKNEMEFNRLVEGIANKSFEEIMQSIWGGVKSAYENNDLPFLTIELEEISAKSLGYYLQFRMIEMMYLAQLLEVNAFDQPGVEDYKKETRKLLEK